MGGTDPKLEGLIAAPHAPMTTSGAIAPEVIPALAEHLAASGVRGVFVSGSTGEWPSLTVRERMRLADAWAVEAPRHGLTLIVHVGALAEVDALELARHAADLPLWGVSALAPCFFKPDLDASGGGVRLQRNAAELDVGGTDGRDRHLRSLRAPSRLVHPTGTLRRMVE